MIVELQGGGKKQGFEVSHAERLLNLKNNGGWQLADKSEFTFNKANGTITRRNKKDTKAAD